MVISGDGGRGAESLQGRRQDAKLASELSSRADDTVQQALDVLHPGAATDATARAANSLKALGMLMGQVRLAGQQQVRGDVENRLNSLNSAPKDGGPLRPAEDVVKQQIMHVCPEGFEPSIDLNRPIGRLIVHYGEEMAVPDTRQMPAAWGLQSLEHRVYGAARTVDAVARGKATPEQAQAVLAQLKHDLTGLYSRQTSVPILAVRMMSEDQQFEGLRGHLSDPEPVLYRRIGQGDAQVYREVPDTPEPLGRLESLSPIIDWAPPR